MPDLNQQQRSDYLRDEYLMLQSQYEDYDNRSLTIKGWVTGGALVASGLTVSVEHSWIVPLFIGVVVISIWYLEACWKLFQYALRGRIKEIEAYFRGDADNLVPMQSYSVWFKSYSVGSRSQRLLTAGFQHFVCLPYLPIIIMCAACSWFLYP